MSWLTIKAKLAAFGVGLLAIAALFTRLSFLKNQNERLERVADTLKARSKAETVRKKIIKKEKERLVSRKADIAAEIEKSDEDFTGIDSLGRS